MWHIIGGTPPASKMGSQQTNEYQIKFYALTNNISETQFSDTLNGCEAKLSVK